LLITFEGIEGSGKSTLLAGFNRALQSMGRKTVVTREPGGTASGDAVRELFLRPGMEWSAFAETLLINASRSQLVKEVIAPALARGEIVLCDRYIDSTIAYQAYGRGSPVETVRELCAIAADSVFPDLTFLVDISYETSRKRLAARDAQTDRLEQESAAFHERVRQGYLRLADSEPRIVRIDGERSQEEMLDAVLAAFSAFAP